MVLIWGTGDGIAWNGGLAGLLIQEGFGNLDVEGGGNLDILTIAIYHCHLAAEALYYRCIVGELLLVFLVECLLG